MGFLEQRQKAKEETTNGYRFDFSWEKQHVPLLHDGFLESVEGSEGKSVLSIQLFFSNGRYRARIQDRQNREQAFCDVGTLAEAFEVLERGLREDQLDWMPYQESRRGGYGP